MAYALSPGTATPGQVGNAVFRLPLKYDSPVVVSFAVILLLVAVSGLVLERRVRGVEVVT